jgi:hypothetical protein
MLKQATGIAAPDPASGGQIMLAARDPAQRELQQFPPSQRACQGDEIVVKTLLI